MNSPLIEGQVPVSELCEQRPLQDLLGRLVLDEVHDDVLQPVVVLRSRVLLSKPQQAGVLQLYGLSGETRGGTQSELNTQSQGFSTGLVPVLVRSQSLT